MELALGALFLAAAVVVVSSIPQMRIVTLDTGQRLERVLPEGGPDLPCPWCKAPTGEDDRQCPSCHQRFG